MGEYVPIRPCEACGDMHAEGDFHTLGTLFIGTTPPDDVEQSGG